MSDTKQDTDTKLKLVHKTLEELGPNLPVGIPITGGGRSRTFRLRPFRFVEEKAIAKLKEEKRGATFGEFIAGVMGIMIHTVGPHTFDNKKEGERTLILSQMTLADVLYMYVWLRYEAMGPDEPLNMNVSCPGCGTSLPINALLGTTVIRTVPDDVQDLTSTVTLKTGLEIRGKVLTKFKIAPIRYDVASNSDFTSTDSATRDSLIIRNSITKAEGDASDPFVLTDDQMEQMTKFDLATLTRAIELAGPGPRMAIDAQCSKPGCKLKFTRAIDWNYERFFSRGAQAETR